LCRFAGNAQEIFHPGDKRLAVPIESILLYGFLGHTVAGRR
jgi:hypothetical protein